MAYRTQFLNRFGNFFLYFFSSDIGVFSCLTNKYCIVAAGNSTNFFSTFEEELSDDIQVFTTTINGTRVIGSMVVGNKNGLLLPSTTTDKELIHIRNSLNDDVIVERVDERLSALGNCISCNDHVALNTIDIIEDVLKVEAFKISIANNPLVGTYCVFSNKGGIVHPKTSKKEQDKISKLIQVPVIAGTINRGSSLIGSGLLVNDWIAFCGTKTTATEISVIESIFCLKDSNPSKLVTGLIFLSNYFRHEKFAH